jgi:hypothetical protein
MEMARTKLDIGKCKTVTGKTFIDYDVMLLAEDGNPLVTISIYKESGMTELQKKAIRKKLKSALDELIANGI